MNYICVFCSANDIADTYKLPSIRFAELIASHGYGLVWGGSDEGLMKVVASTVQEHGAPIVGVSVEFLQQFARTNATEMTIAKDLTERKNIMIEKSDVLVVLPGGMGTLDEIATVLELKGHHIHEKVLVIVNIDHFYDGVITQLERMDHEGFLKRPLHEFLIVTDTPEQAIGVIDQLVHNDRSV